MNIKNPIFVIPESLKRSEQKTGRRNKPKYFGDENRFEIHKRSRVSELDSIISEVRVEQKALTNPEKLVFFEIELNEGALAKSTQPTKLLESSNIDLYSQKSDKVFYASTREDNLESFRNQVSRISRRENADASAYLSAIERIDVISRSDILMGVEVKDEFKGYLYLHDSLSDESCRLINNEINQKFNTNSELFITTSGSKTIYGHFSKSAIEVISEPNPSNPIQRLEPSIQFTISKGNSAKYSLEDVVVTDSTNGAIVGVVDSGLEKNQLLKDFIIGVEDFVKDAGREDRFHGTFVGSRTVYGNDIEEQIVFHKNLIASSKVLDIKVFKTNEQGVMTVDDKELIEAIRTVVGKYKGKVNVFNLSLNNGDFSATLTKNRPLITRELDALAYKHNVIFIVSAGNHHRFFAAGYPQCLTVDEAHISPPADMLNGISVGSIADTDSSRSIAAYNEPSPFTSCGLDGSKKPDLVHYGGNIDRLGHHSGIGVKGLSTTDSHVEEDVGTSYSAPLASQIAAQIYSYLSNYDLSPQSLSNLTRGLLLHSASYELPEKSRIDSADVKRLTGFGIPNLNMALDSAENSATYIYTGEIGNIVDDNSEVFRAGKHKIQFMLPEELKGRGKRVKVKGTLVYTPMISPTGIIDYALADIGMNLHYLNSKGTNQSGNLSESHEDYRQKWNPIKSFEKVFTAYSGGMWEIWLTLNARGTANNQSYNQNYALIVSIEDVTADISNRINLQEIIKIKHPQFVQINNITEKVKVR